jgi:glyoxylase-like metal-dependent hydrolase (beta-lactamase superfamily II)
MSKIDWYETRRYGDDVTLIWEPYVQLGIRCNIWHIRGRNRDLLVDSGSGVVSLKANVELLTEKPALCVATHSHFDHVGNHHEFADRAIHAAEADILAAPTRENTLIEPYVDGDTFTKLPFPTFSPADYAITPAPCTRLLYGGDVIDLGDRRFEVLHLPGHSPGSIGLWEAATGVLFSGDVIYDKRSSYPSWDGSFLDSLYHSKIDLYIESLERLKELPVRIVHGGHYESFGQTRMIEIIERYLARRRGG